jgi:NADPH:quinone reductase
MKAAWYEKQGPAREVLVVGDMPDPMLGAGEVRIRIAASGCRSGQRAHGNGAGRGGFGWTLRCGAGASRGSAGDWHSEVGIGRSHCKEGRRPRSAGKRQGIDFA